MPSLYRLPRFRRKISWGSVLVLVVLAMMQSGGLKSEPSLLKPAPTQYTATASAFFSDAFITRVVDGDTIELSDGRKLRYIGIDAPESVDPRRPVACFGRESSAFNKQLVEGKTVRLEKDVSETDKYGRLLRYVYLGDTMINEKLVRDGYAQAASYPPDVRHMDRLRRAEREARAENRGLWAACNTVH